MVKVKICGITNLDDALESVNSGCDALGFVFYKKSPRYIVPYKARDIIRQLPKRTIKIGVFADAKEKYIRRIAKFCKLDMLQFHGDETPEFCAKFSGYKIIKVFRIKDKIDFSDIRRYNTFAWLFDTFVKSSLGGTGRRFNWKLLDKLDKIDKPVFLSGGLTARSVNGAIKIARPDWVDVSTAVETKPGKKDSAEVAKFVKNAKAMMR